MKNYTITVNGNTYEVSVEENNGPIAKKTAVVPANPMTAPTTQEAKVETPAQTTQPIAPVSSAAGSIKIVAPMPGKIITTKVNVGQFIKKGEVVLILEAMKMENEIVATQDGTIATIDVTPGQAVQAGHLLATMN